MFLCAHDPGLALLLAEQGTLPPEEAAPPHVLRGIMLSILSLNAAAVAVIALA
jgi:hypothetical protein